MKLGSVPALLVSAPFKGSLRALSHALLACSLLCASGVSAAGGAAQSKGKSQAEPKAAPASEARPLLGDGFIVQNSVRVYLGRPATVTLHNARGQQLFHLESSRPMETIPLQGVDAGFLYLTLRAGTIELTKKLVYSGK